MTSWVSQLTCKTFATAFWWFAKYPFVLSGTPSPHQPMRTCFGSEVLGSLILRKANWIFPSENSSTRSSNSPSACCQSR